MREILSGPRFKILGGVSVAKYEVVWVKTGLRHSRELDRNTRQVNVTASPGHVNCLVLVDVSSTLSTVGKMKSGGSMDSNDCAHYNDKQVECVAWIVGGNVLLMYQLPSRYPDSSSFSHILCHFHMSLGMANTSFNRSLWTLQSGTESIKLPYMVYGVFPCMVKFHSSAKNHHYKAQQMDSSYSRLENLKYINSKLLISVHKDKHRLVI